MESIRVRRNQKTKQKEKPSQDDIAVVKLLGAASEQVTGSMYLVEFFGKKILLECGGVQTNNIGKDYQIGRAHV